MKPFLDKLGKEWVVYDGGMGSQLQAVGLSGGEKPETWNLSHPDRVRSVHRRYLQAGADVILTCTFGANRLNFPDPANLKRIVQAAVENARAAVAETRREGQAYVALDIGPLGRLLRPMGDLPFEDAVSMFGEVIRWGAETGVDLIQIETMNDVYEAKAAVIAAKENADLPICATMTFDANGRLLTGGTIGTAAAILQALGVDAFGLNCGVGPREIRNLIGGLKDEVTVPIILKPNAGLPKSIQGETVYTMSADTFASEMRFLAEQGVQALGGCCGTTPEYIRKLKEITREVPFVPNKQKARPVIASYSHTIELGRRPVLIGERINPTGKKKFQQALRNHDIDYIVEQGIRQEEAGADMLDVNVGLPEIDEPQMMEDVLLELQGVTDLPLELDTSNPEAMERGLRLYNGKPLLNSVNGKKESMETVFPLAKKYGAAVVGLCLDENGIPDTAEGRVRIARKILDTASSYGIPREDIVIDGLAMTISTNAAAAGETLETIRRVRQDLGVSTILGVSNISFGLPAREILNSTFLALALENHLSCAIMNPNNAAMQRSWKAFLALHDMDPQCAGFIEAYRDYQPGGAGDGASPGAVSASGEATSRRSAWIGSLAPLTLSQAIERGVAQKAGTLAKEALQERDPLALINEELVPALDRVGKQFEAGTLFLPQLLMSAEAAKAAFAACRDAMQGQVQEVRGRVLLATVKGDIHDIGKNIVKVMLENYGFDVLDLGKDVAPEKVVDTAVKEKIRLVGLSALMTTTVGSMEETIRQLRAADPSIRVVVGGAVITEEYAAQIGADAYARDAMETVRYAESVFGDAAEAAIDFED